MRLYKCIICYENLFMFKNILNIKSSSIISAAVVIGAAGLVSRFLGIIRDRILAGQFGAGDTLDVYYAAFRIPDLIYNLIVIGALSTGFIPVFISLFRKEDSEKYVDNKEAWDMASNIINILSVFFIVLGVIVIAFSQKIVPIITPGFTGEKLQLTINLTRIMFLSPVFLGLSGILGGVLQSCKRFLCFSLSPVMYNLGIIFGALILSNYWGVYGLVWGVVLGAFLHFLIQLPTAIKLGFRYRWILNFGDKSFIKIIKLTAPRLLGLVSTQINLVVVTIFASTLASGSLTIFNLSNNLQNFVIGIFGVSFAMAAFPTLSKAFVDDNLEEFKTTFLKTVKQVLFFVVPATVLMVILRIQVVRVILGAGQFDWSATILTANSLAYFSISLFAQALIPLLARAFYARHNSIIPFVASFVSVIINVIASWYFIKFWGVLGLALSFSISSLVNFIILVVWLKIRIPNVWTDGLIKFIFKLSFISIITGVATQYVKTGLGFVVDMHKFWGVFLQGFVAGIIGIIVFSLVAYWFRLDEFLSFVASAKRKLFKSVKLTEGIKEIDQ